MAYSHILQLLSAISRAVAVTTTKSNRIWHNFASILPSNDIVLINHTQNSGNLDYVSS